MTACGFTPAEIDAMTMADILALLRYWRDAPPAHEILAAVHQIGPAPQPVRDARDPSGLAGLIARFPDGKVPTQER